MTALHKFRDRIHPGALLVVLASIGAASYIEFVYSGPPTLYAVVLWIVVVPMVLAATVDGVRTHSLHPPLMSAGFVAIGILQYLDGDWFLLAGLFVGCGLIGVLLEIRNRVN